VSEAAPDHSEIVEAEATSSTLSFWRAPFARVSLD